MKKPKKIIFLMIDTLRTKSIGLYGQRPSPTPNIDKFSKQSVVFVNAYTTITCTDPAITSMMSGKYPLTIGLVNHGKHISSIEEEQVKEIILLPEILKQHGFKTLAVDWLQRWHKRGYDYYSGRIAEEKKGSYPIFEWLPFPVYLRALDKFFVINFHKTFFTRFYYSFSKQPKIPYDPADTIVNRSISLLEKNRAKNLFLYLHFWDAHAPHVRPRGLKSYLLDNVEKTYLSEIEFLDQQIGRLIGYLDKTDQLKESLIILTADHGENLFEHDMPFNHENLYEDVVKIPLILYHSSFPKKRLENLIQHVDILPTILDFLKIKIEPGLDGKSLVPLIAGETKRHRDLVFFEDITYRRLNIMPVTRRIGILKNNLKYIKTMAGDRKELYGINPEEGVKVSKEELYNIKKDPKERINLILKKRKEIILLKKSLNGQLLWLNNKRLLSDRDIKNKYLESIDIIKRTLKKYSSKDIAIAWKGGKDTTTMMHIIKTIYGKIPFKVFFNDTTLEFNETYQFIEKMKNLWNLDLIVMKHDEEELKVYHREKDANKKKELANFMKINSIKRAVKKFQIKAFMLGIRRDENPARKNEKYFSKREDHIRIHPMLDWTEKDIWYYTKSMGVPYSPLYNQGYRSVGEKPFTQKSNRDERSGREAEKEKLMPRLRNLGYW